MASERQCDFMPVAEKDGLASVDPLPRQVRPRHSRDGQERTEPRLTPVSAHIVVADDHAPAIAAASESTEDQVAG